VPLLKQKANQKSELQRLKQLTRFESEARKEGFQIIAGIDEAGRGPLAGPVVAASCIIPPDIYFNGINDSKLVTPKRRAFLFQEITTHPDVKYAVGIVSPQVIDEINILQATIQAMIQSVNKLSVCPDKLLVDGLALPHEIPSLKIIKGDRLSQSIAAASIIAKEVRDQIIHQYHLRWPHYGFKSHKGYGTAKHIEALRIHGPCPIHRLSFAKVCTR